MKRIDHACARVSHVSGVEDGVVQFLERGATVWLQEEHDSRGQRWRPLREPGNSCVLRWAPEERFGRARRKRCVLCEVPGKRCDLCRRLLETVQATPQVPRRQGRRQEHLVNLRECKNFSA